MTETLEQAIARYMPEPVEPPEPKQWLGLSDTNGIEYWWPGYARQPYMPGVGWLIPNDLTRGAVIGLTLDDTYYLGPHGWHLSALGVLYFNPDGSPTGKGARFHLPRDLAPGDGLRIKWIKSSW